MLEYSVENLLFVMRMYAFRKEAVKLLLASEARSSSNLSRAMSSKSDSGMSYVSSSKLGLASTAAIAKREARVAQLAKSIYQDFFARNSRNELNIPAQVSSPIRSAFEACSAKEGSSSQILDICMLQWSSQSVRDSVGPNVDRLSGLSHLDAESLIRSVASIFDPADESVMTSLSLDSLPRFLRSRAWKAHFRRREETQMQINTL